MTFATELLVALPECVGCIGNATVPRSKILAYFHDDDAELRRRFRLEPCQANEGLYHEHECIIDSSVIAAISYERFSAGRGTGIPSRFRHPRNITDANCRVKRSLRPGFSAMA